MAGLGFTPSPPVHIKMEEVLTNRGFPGTRLQFPRDTIGPNQSITDGETLVSESGIFVLGFFHSGGNRSSRYLGLWYNFSTDIVVWVANRRNPVTNSFGALLQLTEDGNLIVSQNQTSNISTTNDVDMVWSSNSSNTLGNTNITNPTAKLLDSGNLIITNEEDGRVIWQSFNYPSDTLLPGMKLGFDKRTKQQWYLTSWKQPYDPSPGDFVNRMDTGGSHEIYTAINNTIDVRFGPWNGKWFSGVPRMRTYTDERSMYVDNETMAFFRYDMISVNSYARFTAFPNNTLARVVWRIGTDKWISYQSKDECDLYSACGPNGVCNTQELIYCQCYTGFHPKSSTSWSNRDHTLGCERKEKLDCGGKEEFFLVKNLKIPDITNSTIDKNMNLDDCKVGCFNNCSCVAYASVYLEGINIIPRGCIMWFGDLIDTRLLNQDGQDLYLRLPTSEIPNTDNLSGKHKKTSTAIIIPVVVSGIIVLSLFIIFIWVMKKKKKSKTFVQRGIEMATSDDDNRKWKDEVTLFDFSTIASMTNNFSSDNKIGQGGFGFVFKGKMVDGQEIAVKRLSKTSGQGLDEFMNEVVLISKLQHRNLVRLLGCCMEGDERMLVYEFMQNYSLDNFIFGENRHKLDWPKRVEIIIGIARGLLYLHQDSRLRIIHRDLKPGNILLDEFMNAKISDFGTARLFEADTIEENTRRVIGTYGYMPPEYANGGIFSIKSDVFSFGVLMLEIISGKKNRMYYQNELDVSLLELAWMLCKDGKSLIFLDECLSSACSKSQVLRFIQIGLLCVQGYAFDRPTMSDVLFMLSSENSHIQQPKKPAFSNDSISEQGYLTNNMVTFTKIGVR